MVTGDVYDEEGELEMARGWKKVKKNRWENRNKNKLVAILDIGENPKSEPNEISVVIVTSNKPGIEEFFKTKPEAMKFANKYMREHPRG